MMTGGQTDLSLGGEDTKGGTSGIAGSEPRPLPANRPALPIIRANDTELAAHREKLEAISKASGGACLWTEDRKSTRLNSSHVATSYAVFCSKKKTPPHRATR